MTGRYTGLMVEDSGTILLGLFGIMKSGNYVVPINPAFPDDRVRFIVEDCRIKAILTDKTNFVRMQQIARDNTCLEHVICIDDIDFENEIESLTAGNSSDARTGSVQPKQPCYVIYTSGSTGNPKGVSITHRNLVPLLLWFHDYFKLGEHIKVLQNLSYTFDFGIFELVTTLLAGGALYFFNRKEVSDLDEYVDFIHRHQLNTIHTTPSFFTNVIGLGRSLDSLKLLHFGGEKLTRKIAADVSRQVGENCYIYNGYGPTETTINSSIFTMQVGTGHSIDVPDSIPIGKPSANNVIYILDAYGNLQPIGIVGELYIGGGGVAGGYLNRPELTAERFISMDPPGAGLNKSFDQTFSKVWLPAGPAGGKLYKTGDLGRWLPDGNIEFLGRIDFQVKVRGFRIETGEIESWLLKYESIKEAIVIARDEQDGENYLCAYLVVGAKRPVPAITELWEFLSQNLPNYMIPSYFVFLDKIPLNPNGKVDRKALPEPETTGMAAAEYVPPRTGLEEKLVTIWSEVLKIDRLSIGIDNNFFELGGNSLKVTLLISKIHKVLNVSLKLLEIFRLPTIRALAPYIETAVQDTFEAVKEVEEKSYYPLSLVQERFFFFQQLNPNSISYNMYEIMLVEGRLEEEKFLENLKKLIHRHESLRTSFQELDGRPVQKVNKARDILCEIEYYNDVWEAQKIEQNVRDNTGGENGHHGALTGGIAGIGDIFIRPFDLSCAPLLRFGLIKHEEEKHIFMVDMHHIISDGTSTAIFIGDFLSFYNGEELPPLRVRYRDYVYWLLDKRKEGPGTGREIDSGSADDENELLELPTDYMRPVVQSFEGAAVTFETGKEETRVLRQLALKKETTLYMVLFSVFNIFLGRLSGQENIIVGSPAAGRLQDDLEGIIGLFINTLAIRSYPTPDKTFDRFLEEVRKNSLRALEEQEYLYETLVEKIEEARDSSRNPLFDVMFVQQNMDMPELKIPGFKIERNLQEGRSAKFDMTLYCEEADDKLAFHLEYCTKLFKTGTIARFISYFKKIVSVVLADPTIKIGAIEFITGEEKHEILYDFNDKEASYPRDKTIYQLFEEQAARTPEKTAIFASGGPLFEKSGAKTFDEGQERRGEPRVPPSSRYIPENQSPVPLEGARAACLTYRELNERANRLSRVLRAKGVKANAIVGIMLERSVELIVGLYAVLKAGGAYLPIDPEYPENRILSMLENSRAVMLLTGKDVVRRKKLPGISQEIVYVDESGDDLTGQSGKDLDPVSLPMDLIYVIFTSGSTGIPKGAGVYQRGFVNLLNWFVTDFALNESDNNLLMTSFSFDLTQKNLYAPLILGGTLNLPAVNYFDPGEILRDIEADNVTWINCTPSMFFQLIEFCKEDELKKLAGLRYVYLGGEPISIAMFMKWLDSDYCHGEIVNTYGPTECTDISNSYRVKEPRRFLREPVPIGAPIYNVRLVVADRNLQLLPVGIAGELLISGESVGAGYLNDRQLTERKFVSCPFEGATPGRIYYRTGDLVKWLPGGIIEFIGRMDYQVKIRGFRIEIGEIESRLLDHEAIKEAVVIDRDDGSGGKYLCAYYVTPGSLPVSEAGLREYLSGTLPDYMIPSYFVELPELPLNPNGKVDRKALPEPDTSASTGGYSPPRDELEKKLVMMWSEILKIQPESIGIDSNFFHAGGHSLRAAQLTARIHKELDVSIKLAEIFSTPTIRKLSSVIGSAAKVEYFSYEAVEEREYYPLSSAQQRLYFLQRMIPESTAYHIPGVMLLEGDLEKERLQDTFAGLIARHESLRTFFIVVEEDPVQKIHNPEDIEFKIAYSEANPDVGARRPTAWGSVEGAVHHLDDSRQLETDRRGEPCVPPFMRPEIIESFIRPFDLSQAPLLRVGLIKIESKKHILLVDMHHIISDGLSLALLIEEFISISKGEELSYPNYRYKDYSERVNSETGKNLLKNQETFWLEKFSGIIPALNLPLDYPRPGIQDFTGNSLNFEIGPKESTALQNLAQQENVTLYMLLLGIFNIFCARLSGQEDILVGSPIVGRNHTDLSGIIGMFVNMLVLRSQPEAGKGFTDYLREVARETTTALENQDYPFDQLVDKLPVNRDTGRNPLFDVAFSMQNIDTPSIEVPGIKLTPMDYYTGVAKFDLTFECEFFEGRDNSANSAAPVLHITVEYCTALFRQDTIERYITYYKEIVKAILKDSRKKIGEIEVIPEEEKRRILYDFNNAGEEYPIDKTIHELFDRQVQRTPGNIALVYESEQLTYTQLDERSNRLAHSLGKQGTRPNDLVGIMVERTLEMGIGILGILKSGCGYVPLNPKAPVSLRQFILQECGVKIMLTASELSAYSGNIPAGNDSETSVERPATAAHDVTKQYSSQKRPSHENKISTHSSTRGLPEPDAADRAYVIFTSGSTGKPKGVAITHANFCPLVHWGYRVLGIGPEERTIRNLSYYFDWSVWEMFITLTTGASLFMVSDDVLLDPVVCIDFITANDITILHVTPTQYRYIAAQGRKLPTLKYLFIGAEILTYDLTERSFASVNKECRVFNMYGPTEATIIAAVLEIHREEYKNFKRLSNIPIGKPVAGLSLFVLDRNDRLCPINVTGELVVAGPGVAEGYLNRPNLTAQNFILNKSFLGVQGAILQKSPLVAEGKKLYKTGDLARWLPDGNIEFLGRKDYQVKIRGFRIEPGEIENRLLEHDEVKEAVVIDFSMAEGDKYLCAYIVAKNTAPAISDLRRYLTQVLPDYMIPAYFIFIDYIPLNPNGKVDRKVLPEPQALDSAEGYIPPRTKIEGKLVAVWSEVLCIDPGSISIDSNFFEIGGHSLQVMSLVSKIHKELHVSLKLMEIFRLPTIRTIAPYIESTVPDKFKAIKPVLKKEFYPLSPAQERMYLLQQLDKNSTVYNIPAFMLVEGDINRERFTYAFDKLVDRHESLRTSFIVVDEEPAQKIHNPGEIAFEIEYYEPTPSASHHLDASRQLETDRRGEPRVPPSLNPPDELIESFIRPFDLSQAPLLRVGLFKRDEDLHIFIVDMHHIISDGTSIKLLRSEFMELYAGRELPLLNIQYKDYSEWQNSDEQKERIRKQEEYWHTQFAGGVSMLNLPYDYPRPAVKSFAGKTLYFEINREDTAALNRIALDSGTTLYTVLLAIYYVFLAKISGREDIVIGTPTAGRLHADLDPVIGMFVNTLGLRNYPKGDKRFREFLNEVNLRTLEAFENQDYQFELLVEKLDLSRDISRNPIFDVMFSLQNLDMAGINIPGLKLTPYKYENKTAKFDLSLSGFEVENRLKFSLEYSTLLFKEDKINRFTGYFKDILSIVIEDMGIKLNAIHIVDDLITSSPEISQEISGDFGF